jgi:hypothetical protein
MAEYDVDKAITHQDAHAGPKSKGKCAKFVRQAIEAGGIRLRLTITGDAQDYGPSLIAAGFSEKAAGGAPAKGDVAIIPAVPGHLSGHMCMYDGHQWVSDFKQTRGVYPAAEFRKVKPTITFYSK